MTFGVRFFAVVSSPVIKVLLKVKPGLGEGYNRVTCNSCGAGWQAPLFAESVG